MKIRWRKKQSQENEKAAVKQGSVPEVSAPVPSPDSDENMLSTSRLPHDLMYAIEHRFMPHSMFTDTDNMMKIVRKGNLHLLWDVAIKKNGYDNPFKPEDFPDGTEMIRVDLPEPCRAPLCYRVFFIRNTEKNVLGYYTVERSIEPNLQVLCCWTSEGQHMNLGGRTLITASHPDAGMLLAMEGNLIYKHAMGKNSG